ncbi:MAG: hypothetical protein ACFFBD_07870 [Candidatus Hodarchaeota archaeon]
MTKVPGWIRFGFSPGWQDQNAQGLPPMAQWLQQSGLMQEYLDWLKSQTGQQPPTAPVSQPPTAPVNQPPISEKQEKDFLEQQSKILQTQLETLKDRLNELTEEEED